MADIAFTDGEGKTIVLNGSLRISDLVERGIIGPKGWATLRVSLPEPPQPGVYVAPAPKPPAVDTAVSEPYAIP